MPRPSHNLRLQPLEDRCVPAQFNVPWNAPQSLTLSFAPDATSVDGAPSVLFQALEQTGWTQAAWQGEILRAFQSWASQANINIALTNDGGQALGVNGSVKGDGRFGDIRITARPLTGEVLAISSPPGQNDSHSGDVILNSAARFVAGGTGGQNGYDLFTVMLQEAGHTLGLPNSSATDSAMYEYYQGVRGGLSAGDIASVQALYGSRQADDHEGATGNSEFESAASIDRPAGASEGAILLVRGDLSVGDVDVYRFHTPAALPGGEVTVTVSGRMASLVVPRLTVYDANHQVVGAVAASGAGAADLVVQLTGAQADADYYIRVEAADGTAYIAGSYEIRIVTGPASGETVSISPRLADDAHTNDTASQATLLTASTAGNTHYSATAVLRDAADVDYYRIRAVAYNSNKAHLYLTVKATTADGLMPRLQVYNDQNNAVSATAVHDGDGVYAIQVRNVAAGRDYFVKVSAGTGGAELSGGYQFDADCRSAYTSFDATVTGELSAFQSFTYHKMTVNESQVMRFTLAAQDGFGFMSWAGVRVTIYNAARQVVFSQGMRANTAPVTDTALMVAGDYVICIAAGSIFGGGTLLPVEYSLSRSTLTDPIGPEPVDSGGIATDAPNGVDWTPVGQDELDALAALYPVIFPWM